ncbi:MAG TPA: EamA family transporter [Elusimicrobia bacterium]|nr:EamA family transporter [Elusimicrobiota bacterium]HBT61256.1 EamA family transporter [Elusimicrobiota bacterium]
MIRSKFRKFTSGTSAASAPLLLAVLSAALFGAATPASKLLLNGFTPNQLAGVLYLGAALGSLPWAFRGSVQMPWRLDSANRRLLLGSVVFGGVLGPVLVLFGLKAASAASISLWLNLELVATAMLGAVLFRDFMGWRGWAAAGVATLATGILAWGGGAAGIRAAVLVALACACWGLDNQLTSLIDGLAPADATLWKGLAAGAMNLGIGLSLSAWAAGPVMTALALAIGASCYGASIILYITSAQRLGATRSQVIFSTAPFFGVLLAVVVLGEKLSLVQSGSGVLFVSALILLAKEKHQHAHKHEAMEHEHRHSHDDGHHGHRHPGGRPEAEHFHRHGHEQRSHAHPHWPDLHHRHEHD